MTTFDQRLARIAADSGRAPAYAGAGHMLYGSTRSRQAEAAGPGFFTAVLLLPFAIALGGAAVLVGGIFQVAVLDGGLTPATPIPPALGAVSFGLALILTFVMDRIVRSGIVGPLAVTLGFVAMMWGENRLAEMYPDIWIMLYTAEYLQPVLEMAGL